MKCPKCDSERTKVTDKRNSGPTIWRRRECLDCGLRFTTRERTENKPQDIVVGAA